MGGQLVSFPKSKFKQDCSATLACLRATLVQSIDKEYGERLYNDIVSTYLGEQIYIPKLLTAFRDDIALDVAQRYSDGRGIMITLCNEYNVTFATVHSLLRRGKYLLSKAEEKENAGPSGAKCV